MTKLETATLGGGCFWCLEAAYQLIKGVESVTSGFAGGESDNPTFDEVAIGKTGHAEVVQIKFDPGVISYPEILEIFWAIHDPTTLNRQGNDVGTDYRSIILYHDQAQKQQAEGSIKQVSKLWLNPIVTELVPFTKFYPAEEYHQDYFKKNPDQAYCQVIINPKLQKLRAKYSSKLK